MTEKDEDFTDEALATPQDDEAESGAAAGDRIARELLPVSLETEMKRSYLDYAMSVIVGRALPDVRDGLKPVHRRVLFAMHELGNTYNRPHKKAARIVGEVIGKYHPHGDSAAYMTVVRMAQPFSLRYPLVEGQGNFGSIDGDSPAAMRYTEVRLERVSQALLADLDEETVDFTPNFDNSEMEPVVLPTRIPQLLVNGSAGIAVGMATNIPPHHLGETVNACLHLLQHPDASVDELIAHLPAPDFPPGGIIYGLADVHQGYRTGHGRVVMRARTHLEEWGARKDRTRIVVDEIPYMVNKRSLYERMHELVRDKKLEGIAEMRDESSEEIRICIDLKADAMPEVVLNNLFKYTQMQESFGMNMVALVDGQPMTLNLKQMLGYFLAHRREVVTRRTEFRLKKNRAAGHLLEGQAVALNNLDEFIRIIRAAATPEDAGQALYSRGWDAAFVTELTARVGHLAEKRYPGDMEGGRGMRADGLYWLTRAQIDNILSMNLRRLTGLEQDKIRADYHATMDRIIDFLDILARPERVSAIIAEELEAVKEEYGDDRRSTIDPIGGNENFDKRQLLPRRDMVVTLSRDGFVKSQELADYNAQARGGKGRKVQETTRGDEAGELFVANSHDILLCFTTAGRVYPVDVFDLPEGKSNARGRPIVNLFPLQEDEKVTFVLPIQGYEGDEYLFMATDRGTVKKVSLAAFKNVRNKGLICATLDEGESLIGVAVTDDRRDIMLFSDHCRAVRFPSSVVRPMGRSAHGVRGMRVRAHERVVSLVSLEPEEGEVVIATANGFGKRVSTADFAVKGRGIQGVYSIKPAERNGLVVSAVLVHGDDDVMLLSKGGKVIRTRAHEVPVYSRSAKGVRLIRMDDDELASVRRVTRTGAEDEDDLVHLELAPEEMAQAEEDALMPDDEDETPESAEVEKVGVPQE